MSNYYPPHLRIRLARLVVLLTQLDYAECELAEQENVSSRTVRRWEEALIRTLAGEELERLKKAQDILGETRPVPAMGQTGGRNG